jgi:integrase/DNA-binding Xre family transcriptional regulator
VKWNLRLAAANRGIWKASELQRMLAERGMVISAGKMSGLWSGNPNVVKLQDLDVICAVLGCGVEELLIPEPEAKPPPAPAGRPAFRWVQPRLFDAWRDFTRFNEDTDTSLNNPWLAWGLNLAWQRGEARGWRRGLRFSVRRALVILLSRHQPGDTIRYSEIVPLHQALDLRSGRTAEVLQEMGVLDDDRQPAFEDWLERKLDGLAPGVRADAEAWLRTLHDGGPRSRPRDASSVRNYMHYARPLLLAWSSRYGHLREVSREDVMDALDEVRGSRRSNVLVALRSLFGFCKKRKTIFRSPVQGIRVGDRTWGVIQPLSQDEIDQAAAAAATPEARLVVVLAAMHAVRAKAIREIRLDDVDLGNRRIVIGGRARPLDDLTREVLLEWLAHRAARWPSTANPHLLVNQHSANGTGPAGIGYLYKTVFRGKAATLERLRVDRQLQEALAVGPDPLHLASLFGLDPKTAIRYAENARQLLITAAEEQDPVAGTSTNGGHAGGRRGKDAGSGQ